MDIQRYTNLATLSLPEVDAVLALPLGVAPRSLVEMTFVRRLTTEWYGRYRETLEGNIEAESMLDNTPAERHLFVMQKLGRQALDTHEATTEEPFEMTVSGMNDTQLHLLHAGLTNYLEDHQEEANDPTGSYLATADLASAIFVPSGETVSEADRQLVDEMALERQARIDRNMTRMSAMVIEIEHSLAPQV